MSRPRQSDRAFGLTLAALFAIISIVPWLFSRPLPARLLVAALALALVALTAPWVLLPVNRLWVTLTGRLGRVTNFVVLGLFFFLFVLPIGALLRLFGRDPMCRAFEPGARTYWTPVGRDTTPETLEDMF